MRIKYHLRLFWVAFWSIFLTLGICLRAIFRQYRGKVTRAWVDKTMQEWTDQILNLIKVNYVVINPHHVAPEPNKPTLLMCNHTSLYDIPLSFKAFPNASIRMIAKQELSKIPFFGKAMVAAEFPFVNRKDRKEAIKNLAAARALMESGLVMWIAPEGTRSRDGKLAPFKKGGFITAIEAQATIIPIGIRGAYEILPAKTTQLQTNQSVQICIGEPIDASAYSLANKEVLIERVHQAMQALVE
ncbi:MAG: 1-acyl-sn-glycerol-3-phosphate acyltransferase [Legionella sp.]|nr:1-acyl-sn-glycerol-3-phosphate acyltransferase [Legionella sp.]